MLQVEDVDKKFSELDQLKAADWVVVKQSPVKPKRTKVSTDWRVILWKFRSILL